MQDTRRVTIDELADSVIDYMPLMTPMAEAVIKARKFKQLPSTPQDVAAFFLTTSGFMIFHAHPADEVQTSMVEMGLAVMEIAANGYEVMGLDHPLSGATMETIFGTANVSMTKKQSAKEQKANMKALDGVLKALDGDGAGVSSKGEVTILSSNERIAMACAAAAGVVVSATAPREHQEKIFKDARRFIVQGIFIADPEQIKKATGALQ